MSTQSYDTIQSIDSTPAFVPAGITNAILVSSAGAQSALNLKYGAGGSCYIFGVTTGASIPAANFASLLAGGLFWPIGPSEALSFNGPTRFYLGATGATVTIYLLKGKNE